MTSIVVRLAAAALLLLLTAACGFGVLATFEPPGAPALRAVCAVAGLVGVAGAGWLVARVMRDASR